MTLSKSKEEIREMPLVELAFEILKTQKEPAYFRDLMRQIQELRGMTEAQVNDVMARLYTEINMDGRFICIGQNVWGLKRWYPVDKVADKPSTSKRFVRRNTGDAFSDEDDLDADYEEDEDVSDDEEDELLPLDVVDSADDDEDEDEETDLTADEEEEEDFDADEEEISEDEDLESEEEDVSDDEDEEY